MTPDQRREAGRKESFPARVFDALARRSFGTVAKVVTQHPLLALTFDDGPHPRFTKKLMEALDRHDAKATFFMVGRHAEMFPDVVKRVASAGHAVGNHSWDHPSFPRIGSGERRRQIRECARALSPYGLRLFRPPYGHLDRRSLVDAVSLGHQVVAWNVLAQDWLEQDAQGMAERVGTEAEPGSIVVFHDALFDVSGEANEPREGTLEAVRLLLEHLRGRFRFVTVPELLRQGRPHRVTWQFSGNPLAYGRPPRYGDTPRPAE